MKLVIGLKYKGHCIAMDNYFMSILLLKELLSKGIYRMRICRANCIRLQKYFSRGALKASWIGQFIVVGLYHVSRER